MIDPQSLTRRLEGEFGTIAIDAIGNDSYRVLLPNPRAAHDTIALSLERDQDEWVISDGGQLAYLLGDDFTNVVEIVQCAGAGFDIEDGLVVTRTVDEEQIVAQLWSFAFHVMVTPTVWHAVECQRHLEADDMRARPHVPSTILMAREARGALRERLGSRVMPLIQIDHSVRAGGKRARAPFAILPAGSHLPPRLVASFIDTSADPRSVTAAERSTSFLLDITTELSKMPKFVVVRGDESDVADYRRIYGHEHARVLSSEDRVEFVETAESVSKELLGVS